MISPHKARIRHLFFGHVHRPVAGSWLGIPVSSVRSMNHQTWFDLQAGELVASFEPPAYGVVIVDADSVIVHSHDFLDDSPKFAYRENPWDDWSRRPPPAGPAPRSSDPRAGRW